MPGATAVRFTWFSKSPDRSWAVPWHVDRVVSVQEKHDTPGFRNWRRVGDYWHVEAPDDVLSDMAFALCHFDKARADSGGLRFRDRDGNEIAADAAPGDVLVLPMLTPHASRGLVGIQPRRILRVDLASTPLPGRLRFAHAEPIAP